MNLTIEAFPNGAGESNAPTIEVRFEHQTTFDGTALWTHSGIHSASARMTVGTPAQARELAQQLYGAAQALVEHAERAERRAS